MTRAGLRFGSGFFWLAAAAGCRSEVARSAPPDPASATRTLAAAVAGAAGSAALSGIGEAGVYRFELELRPAAPAVGQFFAVVTTVRDARTGEGVRGAEFSLDARMPQHGHGMMTAPEHRELGQGRYLSEGLKLHMPGRWSFSVSAASEQKDQLQMAFLQPPSARR